MKLVESCLRLLLGCKAMGSAFFSLPQERILATLTDQDPSKVRKLPAHLYVVKKGDNREFYPSFYHSSVVGCAQFAPTRYT